MAKDIPKDPSKSLLAHLTGELGIDPLSAQLCHFEEIYFNNLNSFACFIIVELSSFNDDHVQLIYQNKNHNF